jgi:hypothetical protein
MNLLSKIAPGVLLALTLFVLVINARSIYTTPVPNTWVWWSGDETQSMVEERSLLQTGLDTYWYAHNDGVAQGSGILKGSVWLVALLYAGPSFLTHVNFVFVGRTVSALLGLLLLGLVYWGSRRLGARPAIAMAGVLLFATSTCYFVMSHCARPDIPVGIANLLIMVLIVASVSTLGQAELTRKHLFWVGVLFVSTLLVSLHIAMDSTFPLLFLLWRGKAVRGIRDMLRFCSGFAVLFAVLAALYVKTTGAFHLLGSFLPTRSMLPINNIFHPRADISTIILQYFHAREWIPYYLTGGIVVAIGLTLIYFTQQKRADFRLSTSQRLWLEAFPFFILSMVLFEAREARYLIFVIPVFTVTLSFLAEQLWQTINATEWRRGLIVSCSVLLVFITWQSVLRFISMQQVGERIFKTNERLSEQIYNVIMKDAGPNPGSLRTILTMPAMLRLATREHIDPCLPDLGDSEYSTGRGIDKLRKRGVQYIVTCTSSLIRDTYEDDENIEGMPRNELEPIAEYRAIYSDVGRNYSADMYVGIDTVRVYAVR